MKKRKIRAFLFTIAVLSLLWATAVAAQAAAPGKVSIKKVSTATSDCQCVYWQKVSGADGYQIAYRSNSKSYQYMAAKSGSATSAKVTNRRPGVRYTYKVRAYCKNKKKRVYGPWSDAYTTQLDKDVAVYGKDVEYATYGRFFKSEAAARKKLRTITVKTWDFVSGKSGMKYTRTWSLTVNKNIADTVKRVFNQIYKGSEKFPIHDLGGWRWDGGRSEHNDGTAIDINPDENYQIRNGQILAGRLYKPNKNPYSIPTDGQVARIFKKYGFSQGIWNSSQDYMHFSYFGT